MADVLTTPKLVIFDCDGVLVDSEVISNAVMAANITAAGLPTTAEEVAVLFQGMLLGDIGAYVERRLGESLPGAFWGQFDADRTAAFQTSLTAVDGASETVAAIQAAGIKTCVASQARLCKTELTLGLTGLRRLFTDSELFSASSVPRGKPFPDLFLHAACTLGVEPRNCVVVEDSAIGIRAALAAGMQAIAYVPPGATPPSREPGVMTVDRLKHLTRLLPGTRSSHGPPHSEEVDHGGDDLVKPRAISHVDPDGQRSCRVKISSRRLDRVVVQVGEDDVGAVVVRCCGCRPSDGAPRTGDEHGLSCDCVVH